MRNFIRKAYMYGNYLVEKLTRIKTILWYKQLFGEIGKHSTIFKPLRLINPQNIYLGKRVRIYKHSRIETIDRWGDTKFKPTIIIGDGTTFEQRLHLICALRVEIGHDVVVSTDVMITDNNHEYKKINTSVMNQSLEVNETIIGDYCFIGMGARIMSGTKLSKNCIVGANSVVMGEFPAYSVIAGAPGKIIKRYDIEVSTWRRTNSIGDFVDEV